MTPMIDAAALQHRTDTVIIDCRYSLAAPEQGRALYAEGHIQGAYYADLMSDLSSPVEAHGGRHPLPTAANFSAFCERLGIVKGVTEVVLYDDHRLAFASRAWWLLRYFGHDKVQLLNGGFRAWQAAGGVCDTDAPVPLANGRFQAEPNPAMVASRQELLVASVPARFSLIDAREAARYNGEVEPIDPVAGHIPGALNYPWQGLTNEQGEVQPQQARFASLSADDELVVYCGSGVTACVTLLALTLAGKSSPRLYPGSWSDWCSYLTED
ncbi:thiosulfate/3-mercaptopyruvate sulfurtransferase [Sinobacterium caligoides]|uniref:Thiosulfate/3-mercaptopyruvate sulfurtransferase n=1 Tax=Sinobacterium caligoides TaxID=933926 RepID=A0A3N2E0X5_9GAMM|nr:sulfurtransferase [Sinobacterium caligoides]ROS05746.1 thiosulfate/3-mercaptopyruvate sulfurtransferase [Sinobacterium caligoides]